MVTFWNNVGILGEVATPFRPLTTSTAADPFRTAPLIAPAGTESVQVHVELAAPPMPAVSVLVRPTYVDVREAQAVLLDDGEDDPGYIDGNGTPPQGVYWYWEYPEKQTGRTRVEDQSDFWRRADDIFTAGGVWEERVTRVRWNAQEDPNLAVQLDVQDRVRVQRRGVDLDDYRVVGISHEIGAERWMVNLDLVPNEFA